MGGGGSVMGKTQLSKSSHMFSFKCILVFVVIHERAVIGLLLRNCLN